MFTTASAGAHFSGNSSAPHYRADAELAAVTVLAGASRRRRRRSSCHPPAVVSLSSVPFVAFVCSRAPGALLRVMGILIH
eukprot:1279100-Rhodomonas_salina.1